MAAEKATKEPSVLTSIARHIPGLSTSSLASTTTTDAKKKARSRKPKSQPMTTTTSGQDVGTGDETAATKEAGGLPGATAGTTEGLGEVEEKKTSAVEACQKRIRAANKKLQRIATYEEKTEALNADQQRAVASKPALQAVVKELEELLVILKAEEAEDEARDQRNALLEEKKQALAIQQAVETAQSKTDPHVLILLQFLRLHGIYTQQNQGFAPPVLPPVVANATGQEVAAIRMLHDRFINGPLLGGQGDAAETISKIAQESSEEALPGVPYARIKELISGLTAAPADISAPSSEPIAESSAPAGPSDSVVALVDGSTDQTPSFLNASELEQVPTSEEKVASWADEVEATPSNVPTATNGSTAATNWAEAEPLPAAPAPAAADAWGSTQSNTVDWSTEDSGALPSLPELQSQERPPAAPKAADAHVSQIQTPNVDADGFQIARGGQGQQRGGPRGGGRGGFRGGEGGNRGGRGGFRGRSDGTWTRGAPVPAGQDGNASPVEGGPAQNGGRGRGRGGYRGDNRGRGRGEGRGGFKKEFQQGQNGAAGAPQEANGGEAAANKPRW